MRDADSEKPPVGRVDADGLVNALLRRGKPRVDLELNPSQGA